MSAWIYLVIAGVLEVVWALSLKYTDGFTRLWPSVLTLVAMGLSFWLLSLSVRTIPVGVAYPVWVGIGAAGAWVGSIAVLGEPFRAWQVLWVVMIVGGVVGLKLHSGGAAAGGAISPTGAGTP